MTTRSTLFDEILLLDDDEDDYVLIKALLQGAFGEAVKLDWYQKDGVATEMICSGIYALTMVDYRLGLESGLAIIQDAKAHCPDQVIFLVTSWENEVDLEQARKAGAEGYLQKSGLSIEMLQRVFAPFLQNEPGGKSSAR